MVTLDSVDRDLIRLLEEDARQSSEVLAKQLSISSATVRLRTRKLIKSGVIRIVANVDPYMIGLNLAAILALSIDRAYLDAILKFLKERPEVKWVTITTGRFDIQAGVRFVSTKEYTHFIQKEIVKVQGIRNIETFFCLQMEKKLAV